jgi:hypothetical protein
MSNDNFNVKFTTFDSLTSVSKALVNLTFFLCLSSMFFITPTHFEGKVLRQTDWVNRNCIEKLNNSIN